MRVSREKFRKLPLRVHTFLEDVPFVDAWVFDLRGGGEGRTLSDFQALLSSEGMQRVGPVVDRLLRLRLALGRLFGWDDDSHRPPASSYVHRLTEDDRARSLEEPGSASQMSGPLSMRWPPCVYSFTNQALFEIANLTGHHFLHMSIHPASTGYRAYWAIYTKNTSWLTPLYMAIINPFRRAFVYPGVVRKTERAWAARYTAGRESQVNEGSRLPIR